MFIIYDLIYLVLTIIYLPIFLLRKKFHRGFLIRLGILPKDLELNKPIWIHAVSVGEVMAIRGLLEGLRITYPNKKFVISTVTPTGNRIAKSIVGNTDFVTYLPLDFSFMVRSIIDKISPSLFIIAETEIWPNLISYLYKKNIPIIVTNGRISDSSFRGYLIIKFLLKPILNRVNLFCMQTERDKERLIKLGVMQEKIKVSGNMKFDTTDYTDKKTTDFTDYRIKLGLSSKERLWVAGSTHSGEENIILNAYKELSVDFTDLRLLIAPRHHERAKDVEKIVSRYGFKSAFISNLERTTLQQAQRTTVFILDTIGELISFYAIADIVFVGGSLIKKGGHNILEPATLGKPVLFGLYMFNFRDIADLFLKNKAAVLVHNEEDLNSNIKYLLNNPPKTLELSQRAKELILQNQGATRRNLEYIKSVYYPS